MDEAWTTPPSALRAGPGLGSCRRPPPTPRPRHLRRIDQPDPPPARLQQPRPRLGHLATPLRVRVLARPRRRPALPSVEPQAGTRPVQHHRRLPTPTLPVVLARVQQHVRQRVANLRRRPLHHVVEARRQHPPRAPVHPVHAPREPLPPGSSSRWPDRACPPPRRGSARGCPGWSSAPPGTPAARRPRAATPGTPARSRRGATPARRRARAGSPAADSLGRCPPAPVRNARLPDPPPARAGTGAAAAGRPERERGLPGILATLPLHCGCHRLGTANTG